MAVQPILAWLVVVSGYMLILGIIGRVAIGFRIVPRPSMDPQEYKKERRSRICSGAFGLVLFGGIGAALLWPLWR